MENEDTWHQLSFILHGQHKHTNKWEGALTYKVINMNHVSHHLFQDGLVPKLSSFLFRLS